MPFLAPSVAPTVADARPRAPIVVPVAVSGGQGTPIGARPMVKVRVGRSRPVSLLLDTGSTGLRIFAPVVDTSSGSGVTVSSRPSVITYAGGHRFAGVVASAVVKIGRQATAAPVPFSLVRRASCAPAKPSCPTAGGIAGAMADGMFGVLGVGTSRGGQGVINPILGMPGRLGRTWSLHLKGASGALVLGARAPARRAVSARVQLASRGASGGMSFWADQRVPTCLAVGTIRTCVPGLFDSGTFQMQLWGSPFDGAPIEPGTRRLAAGTPVAASIAGSATPFWRFAAGSTKSKDSVTVRTGPPFVNFGVQAFYAFTVTYDARKGTLTLSRRRGGARP